jgi:hypothetical protein
MGDEFFLEWWVSERPSEWLEHAVFVHRLHAQVHFNTSNDYSNRAAQPFRERSDRASRRVFGSGSVVC